MWRGSGKFKRFGDVKSRLRALPWVDRTSLYAIRPLWKSDTATTTYLCIEGAASTQQPSGVDIRYVSVHIDARRYSLASIDEIWISTELFGTLSPSAGDDAVQRVVGTSDYDPRTGLNSADNGSSKDT